MSSRRLRAYRRVARACENCRRKKIRCPGEKPHCSACSRLGQQCLYAEGGPAGPGLGDGGDGRVADRLARLEDKLDRFMRRVEPSPIQEPTPCVVSDDPSSPPATALLPQEIISRALDVYFHKIHRQPLWLFEADSSPSPESSDELISIVMALSLTYASPEFVHADLRSPSFYGSSARRGIMLKVADGAVGIQTLQALCLLAFFNTISGDLPLAALNTVLAKHLMQYSLVSGQYSSDTALGREQAKLFWNITLLDTYYGPPTLVASMGSNNAPPSFASIELRQSSTRCPPLPLVSPPGQPQSLTDMWCHSITTTILWGELRLYIARCFEGSIEAPWKPGSDYTVLCSRLLDVEVVHPVSLTYNALRFCDRSREEVWDRRYDWLSWLRHQVCYHAIHCVLNHPFLYFHSSKHRLGSSTFWRESSEKALRHCTWVSRIIRIAGEKGLELTDPYFAQGAAIAGTLHLYWSKTSDVELRASATANLEICRRLVSRMAQRWPLCAQIEQALDQFVELFRAPNRQANPRQTTIRAKKSLMWLLLDASAPQFPSYSAGLSFDKNAHATSQENREYETVEDPDVHTPPANRRESTAHYASPPEWMAPPPSARGTWPTASQDDTVQAADQHAGYAESMAGTINGHHGGFADFDLVSGPWEHIMHLEDNSIAGINWWDLGNL